MTSVAYLPAAFRKRITIQTLTRASDGQGGSTDTWTDGPEVYCSITPIKAYERYQAMQMQTPVSHNIMMRYRTDITTQIRLKYQDRIFWVKEIINQEERGRFLLIKAIERAGDTVA